MADIIADDGEVHWSWTPKDPNFVPPTIRQNLAEAFDPEADYFVVEGHPVMLFGMMDYAEDWSTDPIHEVHPFTTFRGKKITEAEFRTLVKAMHCIDTREF